MHHPRTTGAALAAAALVLSACADADSGVSPDLPSNPDGARVPAHAQGSPPDRAALARAVPEFGGVFLEDGTPTVYLTDTGERPGMERALAAWMAQEGYAPGQLRVRQGQFAYDDLAEWFEAASREVFAEGEVVLVDLEEAGNRILIGVETPGSVGRVRAAAARAGVPPEALSVEVREPMEMLYSLRDRAPTIIGGLQIRSPLYFCTLGFTAVQSGGDHFVTNSHCTNTQGGVEGTPYWQPDNDTEQIGTEVKDPKYSRNLPGCPRGRVCRYSDAALVSAQGTRSYGIGQIADVAIGAPLPFEVRGTLTITERQTSNVGNCVVEGTTIHKVGRTTGHTLGTVTNACADVGVSGTNIVQLQQVIVSGSGQIINSGDSGSPAYHESGNGNVRLEGIIWGGSSSTMVFSPLANVEQELGGLTVIGGGPPPANQPPTAAFSVSCTELTCAFTDESTDPDPDGSIVEWAWTFGDGATSDVENPTHTYAQGGSFSVSLTVTDNDGASDSQTGTANPTDPSTGGISLSVTARKVKGVHTVDLSWSGATSANVDVRRDGPVVTTTANDGAHTDDTGNKGGNVTYVYQVCEAGTTTCSNTATAVL